MTKHKKLPVHILLLSLLLGLPALSALSSILKGRIVDDQKEPLPGTSVQLLLLPDSLRKGYVMADENGGFAFNKVDSGKYALRLDLSGMDRRTIVLDIPTDRDTIDLGNIRLDENATTLEGVVVTGVRAAVVAKQDTIEFNAGSFRTQQNATVEDLLKKLPGVEVGSDGSIKSQGKTISKILIDGEEFFADDPKIASKNLPSDIVEKVQVIDRKSDQARLTGIDDGDDETVINLSVKKGMNNGWFGTIGGGYGTDGRYQANLNVNFFRNGNQISLIGGANNINEMGFTDMGRGRFRDFGGNNGINSTQQFGINFNVGKEKKIRFGGNLFYSHSKRDSRSRSTTQYLLADSTSVQQSLANTIDRGHSVRGDFRLQWNIDPANVIDFRPRFSFNDRRSESDADKSLISGGFDGQLVNTDISRRFNRGTSWEASGDLIWNHKFLSRPGRSFSVRARYSFSDTRQHTTSLSEIEYLLLNKDAETLFRYLDNKNWSNLVEGRLTWSEPLGNPANGNAIQIAYRMQYSWNNGDRLTYNLPTGLVTDDGIPNLNAVPDGAVADYDLSNRFRNNFMTQELQVGFSRKTSAYNLNAGMIFAPSYSQSHDLINPDRNIPKRWVWNVAPYLRFRYKFSKNSSLMLHYRARTSSPSLTALQPVADVSDPLNISVGNPELKPTFTQSLGGHINLYDEDRQQSISAFLNASYALNSVVGRTITDHETGVRTSTYANANGDWQVMGMGMINAPFRGSHWRYSGRLMLRYANSPGYLNGEFNRSGNFNASPSIGVTYSIDLAQFSLNPTYSFSMATNSLPEQKNRYVHSYGFQASAQVDLPFGLQLSTDLDFSKASGYSAGYNQAQWLWNAQIAYSTLSDKSLTFSVRAYDMLGQKKNISRSVSSGMIVDNEYNDLTRYVMFGVSWTFNTMKKKVKRPEGFDGPPDGLPMGPPPGEGPGRQGGQGRPPMGPPPGAPGHF